MDAATLLRPLPPAQTYQDFAHDNRGLFFCGMTGTGKTTLALECLRRERQDWKIVFDPERQWSRRMGCYCAETRSMMFRALAQCRSVCWDSTREFRHKAEAFDWLCDALWNFSGRYRGSKLIVLDDFPDYMRNDNDAYLAHRVSELRGAGRRRGVDFFALCRNVVESCSLFRGSMTQVFAFKQPDLTCARNVAGWGFDLKSIQGLKLGEFLKLDVMQAKFCGGKVTLPAKK